MRVWGHAEVDLTSQMTPAQAAGDLLDAIRAARHGEARSVTLDGERIAAIVPAGRCSACNRVSGVMRDKGGGVLWCGRVDCLPAIRELARD